MKNVPKLRWIILCGFLLYIVLDAFIGNKTTKTIEKCIIRFEKVFPKCVDFIISHNITKYVKMIATIFVGDKIFE